MNNFGETRSRNHRDHLLLTPDTFVRTTMPGVERGSVIVHVSPAVGAKFTQCTAELEAGGTMTSVPMQRFVYVLSGSVDLVSGGSSKSLVPGGYAYIPSGLDCTLAARNESRLAVIEKSYQPFAGAAASGLLVGNESNVPSTALMGDEDLQVRSLLPNQPTFDFAVNTMSYQPGAALSQVEIHVMEHGLLMLEGGGIYRLGDAWYSVNAGDFVWMAPYCPQWFGALGKTPAKYLIYKDCNRHPLG
jgi:(S)-ureidoglycine aminohydrolase